MIHFMKQLLLGALLVCLSEAGYVLKLELQSFSNPQHRLANGSCCEVGTAGSTCGGSCDVAFVFCWKDYRSPSNSIGPDACYSRGSTSVYGDGDYTTFNLGPLPSNSMNNQLSNPLSITGDIWPGGMQMFIRSVHDSGSKRILIDHIRLQESLAQGTTTEFRTYPGLENNANLVARFSLTCTDEYYQPNCSTYCAPQDSDDMGHYRCNPQTGEKICLPGYSDPDTNCIACATATGCSPENGFCNEPDECICREGYTGTSCLQDLDVCGHTRPCLRGQCINLGLNNYRCECPTNYFGLKCEQYYEDIVRCSDSLCQNRGSCISGEGSSHTCSCHGGYSGVNCTDDLDMCRHLAPCQNGATCTNNGANAYICQCTPGYHGPDCHLPTAVSVTDTSPSENSTTAEPTVGESSHGIPALPVIAGSVLGGLALLCAILCALVCLKKRGCLSSARKVNRDPDTSHVYTDVRTSRTQTISSSNQPSSSSPDSNHISDSSTEIQQQQEFTNPLYSETDHYSSIVDFPQRRDSSAQLSSSHYSNPVELSHPNHDYQSVNQQGKSLDEKLFEPSPYYAVIRDRQVSFHGTPTPVSPNTPTKHSVRSTSRSFSGREDQYSEPADSLKAAKQPPFYHVLENGAPDAGVSPTNPAPPLYMLLEEPSGPVKVPVNTEYAEANVLSRIPPPICTTDSALPEYEELDT